MTATAQRTRSIFDSPGRMMSASKTGPKGHVCVWNANVLSKTRGKFWFGDLDLTSDAAEMRTLASKEGEPIYVLREKDARFATEADPNWGNAVAIVYPDGKMEIDDTHH